MKDMSFGNHDSCISCFSCLIFLSFPLSAKLSLPQLHLVKVKA
jgi:hypothetical protein